MITACALRSGGPIVCASCDPCCLRLLLSLLAESRRRRATCVANGLNSFVKISDSVTTISWNPLRRGARVTRIPITNRACVPPMTRDVGTRRGRCGSCLWRSCTRDWHGLSNSRREIQEGWQSMTMATSIRLVKANLLDSTGAAERHALVPDFSVSKSNS